MYASAARLRASAAIEAERIFLLTGILGWNGYQSMGDSDCSERSKLSRSAITATWSLHLLYIVENLLIPEYCRRKSKAA